jgi:hypothetical protein
MILPDAARDASRSISFSAQDKVLGRGEEVPSKEFDGATGSEGRHMNILVGMHPSRQTSAVRVLRNHAERGQVHGMMVRFMDGGKEMWARIMGSGSRRSAAHAGNVQEYTIERFDGKEMLEPWSVEKTFAGIVSHLDYIKVEPDSGRTVDIFHLSKALASKSSNWSQDVWN